MVRSLKAYIEAEMLRWAREDAGYSIEVAAKKAQVKPEKLKQWEEGEGEPTIVQLRKLGKVYKRPLAFFYLPEPPRDFQAINDYRHLPDEEIGQQSPELIFEIRRAHGLRELAKELYEAIESTIPKFGLQTSLADDAESVAIKIREHLRLDYESQTEISSGNPSYNFWRSAIEDSGILVLQTSGISVEEMRGFSISDANFPVIVVNSRDTYTGRTFSMLHEFAHIMLHKEGLCTLSESPDLDYTKRLVEIFCNKVAGATLVPRTSLFQEPEVVNHGHEKEWSDVAIKSLANRYGASREVILRRLVLFGRASEQFYRIKRKQYYEEYIKFLNKKKPGYPKHHHIIISRTGKLFARLVFESFYRDILTLGDVSEYLGTKVKHLTTIENEIFKSTSDMKLAS